MVKQIVDFTIRTHGKGATLTEGVGFLHGLKTTFPSGVLKYTFTIYPTAVSIAITDEKKKKRKNVEE